LRAAGAVVASDIDPRPGFMTDANLGPPPRPIRVPRYA